MTDLTKNEIFELVDDVFNTTIGTLQSRFPGRADLYKALTMSSVEVIGFAIATMIVNDAISKDRALKLTIDDIKNSVDDFLETMKHHDNLN